MTQTSSRHDLFPSRRGAQGCVVRVNTRVVPVEEAEALVRVGMLDQVQRAFVQGGRA